MHRHARAHRLEADQIEGRREERALLDVEQVAAVALAALRRGQPASHIAPVVRARDNHFRRPGFRRASAGMRATTMLAMSKLPVVELSV